MNIKDYLEWRGDVSLAYSPFNDVDNLCLCQAFYIKFEELIDSVNDVYTIKQLSDLYFKNHSEEELKDESDSPNILRLLAQSVRFKDAKLHHFVSIYNEESMEQFAVAQIELSDGNCFVVFRGTDDTLVGWKEDFKLAYDVISSQVSANEYVLKYLKPFKKYIFAGHSKGGALALSAAMNCPSMIQRNIEVIYSNDGPGLNDKYFYNEEFKAIKDRIIKIVPEFDIIGTIFDNKEIKHIVAKANANPIMQHSVSSWEILNNKIIETQINELSEVIKEGFDDFLTNVEISKRKKFVLEVFDALDELHIHTLSELSQIGIKPFINALMVIGDMDEEVKDTANKFISIFTKILEYKAKSTSQMINDKANQAKEEISEYITNKAKQIKKVKIK